MAAKLSYFLLIALIPLCPLYPVDEVKRALFSERYTLCKGEKIFEISYWSYESSQFFDRWGDKQESFNNCRIHEGNFEAKYGVTRCDTLRFKGGFGAVEEELDGNRRGFNDFSLSWSRLFATCRSVDYGMRLKAIVPVDYTYAPCLRYGQYGGEASLFFSQYSRRFLLPLHLFGDFGYLYYCGFPSDQIRSEIGVTLALLPSFAVELRSQIDFGLFNGKSRLDQSLIWMNPNYRLWRGEVEAKLFLFNALSINVGCFYHFIGQNVGTGGGLFTKASLTF